MSEPVRKIKQTPESFSPKNRPEILSIVESMQQNNKNMENKKIRELIKSYKHDVPALRFIGKKYGESDSIDGFGHLWNIWFEKGWFNIIEKQIDGEIKDTCEDGEAPIGLIGGSGTQEDPMTYWIGLFMPKNTPVPEGFEHIDFSERKFGICWVYGKPNELYGNYGECCKKIDEYGFEWHEDSKWCFERYVYSRFSMPDEKGNVILDIGFFVK